MVIPDSFHKPRAVSPGAVPRLALAVACACASAFLFPLPMTAAWPAVRVYLAEGPAASFPTARRLAAACAVAAGALLRVLSSHSPPTSPSALSPGSPLLGLLHLSPLPPPSLSRSRPLA